MTASTEIRKIRTLGPVGTNCEAAAKHYTSMRNLSAETILHPTLEEAIEKVIVEDDAALLGCVVYPDLHKLVFPFLGKMTLLETFMFNTFNMVLAAKNKNDDFDVVATHPAPRSLVTSEYEVRLANSNSEAAKLCRSGEVGACITTLPAAKAEGLEVVTDHGQVPMGFTIHVPVQEMAAHA